MKKLYLILGACLIAVVIFAYRETPLDITIEKETVNLFLDEWHAAAAKADYKGYFDKIADDGRYIGTDANENWDKKAFEAFAKPYFNRGKAWDFKAVERNIYFSKDGKTAWFDELLDTWMKACRGSGVLEKQDGKWKIKHYVLSMTVPNEITKEVLPLKAKYENALIEKLKNHNKK
jgi:hypothetical protein